MAADNSQDDEPSVDRRSAVVGIVCTQKSEIAALLQVLDRQRSYTDCDATFRGGFIDESIRVAVVEAGCGFAQQRQATEILIAEHHPKWMFSVGFSSPLIDDLQQGDVCVANEICDTHGNSLRVKSPVVPSDRVRVAKHVVADAHPATVADRQELEKSTQAVAVDTASLAVGQLCRSADDSSTDLPRFFSIRGIVKPQAQDLSEPTMRHLFTPDQTERRSLISRLTQRIRKDPELAALDALADQTCRNLNRFILSLIRKVAT